MTGWGVRGFWGVVRCFLMWEAHVFYNVLTPYIRCPYFSECSSSQLKRRVVVLILNRMNGGPIHAPSWDPPIRVLWAPPASAAYSVTTHPGLWPAVARRGSPTSTGPAEPAAPQPEQCPSPGGGPGTGARLGPPHVGPREPTSHYHLLAQPCCGCPRGQPAGAHGHCADEG